MTLKKEDFGFDISRQTLSFVKYLMKCRKMENTASA
jgi:hypothetical protein